MKLDKSLLSLISLSYLSLCGCVQLDLNGIGDRVRSSATTRGYDIVIGIDDSTQPPENVTHFIQEFWANMDAFSNLMFEASHHHFYIRSAELVVPAVWNATNISSADSYHTAHIRVSPRVTSPRADNPHLCGESGNYIELPSTFFNGNENNDEDSQYGSKDKALLHLWARYRWGVWEEHGYPGSTKFPYFYKRDEEDWQPVGCSDEELAGEFLNKDGERDSCGNDGEYSPGSDCRFYPFPNNTATTSLMYLTSLDSVVSFCTADNHNTETPNKQNMFCQHKSTWETIESSPDFNTGEAFLDSRPPIAAKVIKKSARPLLYVLLDRGRTAIPESSFTAIKESLSTVFDRSVPDGCVSAIGSFPDPQFGTDPKVTSIVTELMPWTHAQVSLEAFKSEINNYALNGPTFRDFGLALYDTVNNIKAKKHALGTILVVLKVGAGRDFGSIQYEEEIVAAAAEAKIKLFIIEVQNTATRPNINLLNLANRLDGTHVAIRSTAEVLLIEYLILPSIYNQFRQPISDQTHRVIHKGRSSQGTDLVVKSLTQDLSFVHVSFTTSMALNSISATYNGTVHNLVGSVRHEWGQSVDGEVRLVYSARIEVASDQNELSFRFTCPPAVSPANCNGLVVIHGLPKSTRADPYNIQVLAASREISYASNEEHLLYVEGPFNILAKVERNGRPVKNLRSVRAVVSNLVESWMIELEDNGGPPDVYSNDGVYSGFFIPMTDGVYRVHVEVSHNSTTEDGSDLESRPHHENSSRSRLLPTNQVNVGCSIGQCNAINPVETFLRIQDLQHSIVAQGFAKWENQFVPARISNLHAWAASDFYVNLYWTSPPIYHANKNDLADELRVDGYEIYVSDDIDSLLGDFTGSAIEVDVTSEPGVEEFWQDTFMNASETNFIGVRGTYNGVRGAMSNIVKVIARENATVTTTPVPTTTTEEPTEEEVSTVFTTPSTTTRRVTTTTEEPTEEEVSTVFTTPSTTTRRVTTTTTPSPIMTSEVPSTEATDEDSKSWIQKPEGYLTIAGFAVGVVLIGIAAAVLLFCKNRCLKKANDDNQTSRLVTNAKPGRNRL